MHGTANTPKRRTCPHAHVSANDTIYITNNF